MVEPTVGGVVIALVHGTWARGARWTMPDSVLCEHLRATVLELREVAIFDWSGSVLQRKRFAATTEFLRWHEKLRQRHPRAQHFIIAHSHGGNVVVEAALQSQALRSSLGGIICVSTPFLQFSELPEAQDSAFRDLAFGGVIFIWWVYLLPLLPFWVLLTLSLTPGLIGAILGRLSLMDEFNLTSTPALDWGKTSASHGDRWGERPRNLNLLIVRSPGDEASSALGALQLFGWASTRVLRVAERLFGTLSEQVVGSRPLLQFVILGLVFLGASMMSSIVYLWFGTPLEERLPNWMLSRLPNYLLLTLDQQKQYLHIILDPFSTAQRLSDSGAIVFLLIYGFGTFCIVTALFWHLLTLFVLALSAALYLLRLPFGFIAPMGLFRYAITAEACPPGEWRILQASLHQRTSALSHSELYSQPTILQRMSEWIAHTRAGIEYR